jgi:hypothetical protein
MTTTHTAPTGTWTTRLAVLRDGSDLLLCLTVQHDTGETYRACRRGPGVRYMAGKPVAEQVEWIAETVREGEWKAVGAVKMFRERHA